MTTLRSAASFAALVLIFGVCQVAVRAQTPPYLQMQYSTLTGSGNTITATMLPVVTSTGITYQNVTLLFDVDSSGNITLAPGYPQLVPSPTPIISGFLAGNYVGPSTIFGGKALITVSGPSVGPGGTTEWTISASSGANACTYPDSATWYVGPLTSNPLSARLKKDGITSPDYSYGVGSSQCTNALHWGTNTLLGLSQVGDTLTIYSYTYNSADSSLPVDQITYTKLQ